MNKSENHISKNLIDFIDHCNGYTNAGRRGFWFLDEVYGADPIRIEKAFKKCLGTLKKINKEGIDQESEFVLVDRVFELNYRTLGRYLNRRIKKDVLNNLQKINYFVQAIVCRDVKDLEKHYRLNRNL